MKGKLPTQINQALHLGFDIIDYKYIVDSIAETRNRAIKDYVVTPQNSSKSVLKALSLHKKHFNRQKSMLSQIKVRNRKGKLPGEVSCERNVAIYYANISRRSRMEGQHLSFSQSRMLYVKLLKNWKTLPQHEKDVYVRQWLAKKCKLNERKKRIARLVKYNQIEHPSFKSIQT